ncbi:MAG: hypothetical protein AAFY71_00980 [Bacteroidota bacterium]
MAEERTFTEEEQLILRDYKRRLYGLIGVSSTIDVILSAAEIIAFIPTGGSSLIVDEIVEWIISSLLAKNKMDLKMRYKIVGLLPIPGLTSLSFQAWRELRKLKKEPEEILAKMREEGEMVENKA